MSVPLNHHGGRMLIESTVHLPVSLANFQDLFHAPDRVALARIGLRWIHFVAGITWIGLLYFFNLVNVPFQKGLDADTKKKVNPDLLGRALWYFRWSALVTVLAGLGYYAQYILKPDVHNAKANGSSVNGYLLLGVWLVIPIVTFLIEFLLIKKVPAVIKDGRVWAIIALILVAVMAVVILKYLDSGLSVPGKYVASNSSLSIGVDG